MSRADDALIRSMAGEGRSLREIGEAVGLSHTQIRRVLAAPVPEPAPAPGDLAGELEAFAAELEAAGVAGPAELVRRAVVALTAPAGERDDDDPIDPNAPALDVARDLIGRLRRSQAQEEAIGNARAASYAARTLATALPLLGRLERAARDESAGFWTSYAELERKKAEYAERVRRVLALGPLTCAACGARIRREAATG